MDSKDIRRLKILEAIEGNASPSQRELSVRLHISLGLVNAEIRTSAKNGFVTIHPLSKNRFQYELTSLGVLEKRRLTHDFFRYGYRFFKEAQDKIRNLFTALEKKNIRRLVFFGAGELAEIAFATLQGTGLEMVAIIDGRKTGEIFSGMTIREIDCLQELPYDCILVTCDDFAEKLNGSHMKHKIPLTKIVRLA